MNELSFLSYTLALILVFAQTGVAQVPSSRAGADGKLSARVMLDDHVVMSWRPEEASGLFGPKIELKSLDTSNWTVKDGKAAVAKAERVLGITPGSHPATAQLIAVLDDDTPFLTQLLLERAMWQVVVRDWTLSLPTAPSAYRDPYVRTFDVLTDPIRGTVLKVTSRWPEGRPGMPPTVDAATAAEQMRNAGRETYHGFPTENPRISFFEAVEILERVGWVPRRAGQVVAEYVMWSRMGQKPRAVWAVMLRGVPVLKPPPGTPKDYQDQYRHIVDAQTGEWLWTTNLPRPARSGSKGE